MKHHLIRLSLVIVALATLCLTQSTAITLQSIRPGGGVVCQSEALLNELGKSGFTPPPPGPSGVSKPSLSAVVPQVRMIYLVPSDLEPRADYKVGMNNALRHLQRWYWEQSPGGESFLPRNTVVETVRSAHDSGWFITNQKGDNLSLNLWFNSIDEASARFNDPEFIYIIYADVDASGQTIGGASGVAVLARHDLVALAGQQAGEQNACRSVGGLGHEIGHALGLPHPPECDSHQASDDSPPCQSLMYLGYLNYPATYFIDEHKDRLRQSAFIIPQQMEGPPRGCADLLRAGPSISSALFDGKKSLTIEGGGFGGSPGVIVNDKDRTKFVISSSESSVGVKAKKAKLGIKPGDNEVQVKDEAGFISGTFKLRF